MLKSKKLFVALAATMLLAVALLLSRSVLAKSRTSDGAVKNDKEISITFKYVDNQSQEASEPEENYVVSYEKKANVDEPAEYNNVVTETFYLPD